MVLVAGSASCPGVETAEVLCSGDVVPVSLGTIARAPVGGDDDAVGAPVAHSSDPAAAKTIVSMKTVTFGHVAPPIGP